MLSFSPFLTMFSKDIFLSVLKIEFFVKSFGSSKLKFDRNSRHWVLPVGEYQKSPFHVTGSSSWAFLSGS